MTKLDAFCLGIQALNHEMSVIDTILICNFQKAFHDATPFDWIVAHSK